MTPKGSLCTGLRIEKLKKLLSDLQLLKDYPPKVKKSEGRREGDILGFVKGLKISAGVIYYLRDQLSDMNDYEVSWGHILDDSGASCSPECDVIIHKKGHVGEWNGSSGEPIMHFKFVNANTVKAVVSCKSQLDSIDKQYPKSLKKYGVKDVFLFVECCKNTHYPLLEKRARQAGYRGLWPLYLTSKVESCITNDNMYVDFRDKVRKALKK